MRPATIGLVGAGFVGRVHLAASEQVPDLEIVGVVDPDADRSRPELAGAVFFDDVASLLRSGVEGVIVAVPDALHVPMALQCLDAGVAVLLEKPAATSLAECVHLGRSGRSVEDRLLVGHHRRHHPASTAVRSLLASGRLGRLLAVSGTFALRKDDGYFSERPRGVGLVNLIHDLDLLQYFCGRITHVSAEVSHLGRHAAEEDTVAMTLSFEGGVIGTMVATDASPSPWGWDQATADLPSIPFTHAGTTYNLMGREASVSVPDLRFFEHAGAGAWHEPLAVTTVAVAPANAYVCQLRHFADVVRGGARPIAGIADAIATQAALDAVFVSAGEGRRVATAELVGAC